MINSDLWPKTYLFNLSQITYVTKWAYVTFVIWGLLTNKNVTKWRTVTNSQSVTNWLVTKVINVTKVTSVTKVTNVTYILDEQQTE